MLPSLLTRYLLLASTCNVTLDSSISGYSLNTSDNVRTVSRQASSSNPDSAGGSISTTASSSEKSGTGSSCTRFWMKARFWASCSSASL